VTATTLTLVGAEDNKMVHSRGDIGFVLNASQSLITYLHRRRVLCRTEGKWMAALSYYWRPWIYRGWILLEMDNNSDHDVFHTLESEPWYLRLVVLMYRVFCTVSCRLDVCWPLVNTSAVFLKKKHNIYCWNNKFLRRRVTGYEGVALAWVICTEVFLLIGNWIYS
jgi:hypothetical protein